MGFYLNKMALLFKRILVKCSPEVLLLTNSSKINGQISFCRRLSSDNQALPDRRPKSVLPKLKLPSDDFTVSNISKASGQNASNQKDQTSAWQYAKKFRASIIKEKEKQNITGRFNVINFSKFDDVHLAKYLQRNVLFANKKLVAINKPYGIPCHGGDGVTTDIKQVLPMLSKMIYGINSDIELNLCHRLDRFTTGVLIFGTNPDITRDISLLFRQQKVFKKYWAITVGAPGMPKGVIDIPLRETFIKGDGRSKPHARMTSCPDVWYDETLGKTVPLKNKRGHYAVTHYNVLDSARGLSLIELQPKTTIKHQLRVHAAEGLSSVILGDHKYSNEGQLMPQKLPAKVLKQFDISPTKTRNIPLHLHLRQILIPGVSEKPNKPNICFQAKVGSHFAETLHKFRLKPTMMYSQHEWEAMNNPTELKVAAPRDPDNDLYFDPTA